MARGATKSSYAGRMDLGVVVDFIIIMLGGLLVGTGLSVARPRDEEAAAMHRRQARRAVAWLRRLRSHRVGIQPGTGPSHHEAAAEAEDRVSA